MVIVILLQHVWIDLRTALEILIAVSVALPYLAAANTRELELFLAESVRRTLAFTNITEKEAADAMKMDESYLRRCLRGECDLSLTKMVRLPYRFWPVFGPMLLFIVAQKRADEIAESFGLEAERVCAQAVFETLPSRRERNERPPERLRA